MTVYTPLECNNVLNLEWRILIDAVKECIKFLVQGGQAHWEAWQEDLNVPTPCGIQQSLHLCTYTCCPCWERRHK